MALIGALVRSYFGWKNSYVPAELGTWFEYWSVNIGAAIILALTAFALGFLYRHIRNWVSKRREYP